MMHRCSNCPGVAQLRVFLDEQLNELDPNAEFHYYQWETTDWATLKTMTSTCEEYKEVLVNAIDTLTKHS